MRAGRPFSIDWVLVSFNFNVGVAPVGANSDFEVRRSALAVLVFRAMGKCKRAYRASHHQ